MGYKPQDQFNVLYDTVSMMRDIVLDTLATIKIRATHRISAINDRESPSA